MISRAIRMPRKKGENAVRRRQIHPVKYITKFSVRTVRSVFKILFSRKITTKHADEKSRPINALVSLAYHAANSCKSCRTECLLSDGT